MIIIIDSIDRVGKTTLANKLAKELNGNIYKHSIKNGSYSEMNDDSETCAMFALINLANTYSDSVTIFDRFHLSNTIYGLIERDYDEIGAIVNFINLDNALSELDDVVLIKVNPTDLNMSSEQHGKDLTPYYNMFNKLYNMSNIKTKIECDYNSINDVIKKLKK